jgi:hypothetical protein
LLLEDFRGRFLILALAVGFDDVVVEKKLEFVESFELIRFFLL